MAFNFKKIGDAKGFTYVNDALGEGDSSGEKIKDVTKHSLFTPRAKKKGTYKKEEVQKRRSVDFLKKPEKKYIALDKSDSGSSNSLFSPTLGSEFVLLEGDVSFLSPPRGPSNNSPSNPEKISSKNKDLAPNSSSKKEKKKNRKPRLSVELKYRKDKDQPWTTKKVISSPKKSPPNTNPLFVRPPESDESSDHFVTLDVEVLDLQEKPTLVSSSQKSVGEQLDAYKNIFIPSLLTEPLHQAYYALWYKEKEKKQSDFASLPYAQRYKKSLKMIEKILKKPIKDATLDEMKKIYGDAVSQRVYDWFAADKEKFLKQKRLNAVNEMHFKHPFWLLLPPENVDIKITQRDIKMEKEAVKSTCAGLLKLHDEYETKNIPPEQRLYGIKRTNGTEFALPFLTENQIGDIKHNVLPDLPILREMYPYYFEERDEAFRNVNSLFRNSVDLEDRPPPLSSPRKPKKVSSKVQYDLFEDDRTWYKNIVFPCTLTTSTQQTYFAVRLKDLIEKVPDFSTSPPAIKDFAYQYIENEILKLETTEREPEIIEGDPIKLETKEIEQKIVEILKSYEKHSGSSVFKEIGGYFHEKKDQILTKEQKERKTLERFYTSEGWSGEPLEAKIEEILRKGERKKVRKTCNILVKTAHPGQEVIFSHSIGKKEKIYYTLGVLTSEEINNLGKEDPLLPDRPILREIYPRHFEVRDKKARLQRRKRLADK